MNTVARPLVRNAEEVLSEIAKQKENIPVVINGDATISKLAAYIKDAWAAAVEAKKDIQIRMTACSRQLKGEYGAAKLAEIQKFGGSEQYMNMTEVKSRATKAWLKDIVKEASAPFVIEPTPVPDLSPEDEAEIEEKVLNEIYAGNNSGALNIDEKARSEIINMKKQEAAKKIKNMTAKIRDDQVQGNWREAVNDFISDVVDYPAGFLKGPVFRREDTLVWSKGENSSTKPEVKNIIKKHWLRVSPFDIYPSPSSTTIDDGFLFEHHRMTRDSLYNMIGQPGYNDSAIKKVLEKQTNNKLGDWMFTAKQAEEAEAIDPNTTYTGPDAKIDALEYWGKIKGEDLLDFGMSKAKIKDSNKMYLANVWMIGDEVIKAILNPHPLGKKPYYRTSFSKTTGSFWGKSLAEIIEDVQNILNAIARHLVNNVAIASGPQVYKDVALMEEGEDPNYIAPWQVHLYDSSQITVGASSSTPIGFFQPNMQVSSLMRAFQFFKELGDEYTGIPAYTYGVAKVGGAARTASGLSMLITAAGKVIGNIMLDIDREVIVPAVKYHYEMLMLFDPDEEIKGDVNIIAGGTTTLIAKEQQLIRLTEFMNILNNPTDNAIVGMKGRANLLRMVLRQFPLNVNEIIPSEEEIDERMKREEMAMQEQQGQAMAPENPNELNVAGEPMAGGDFALYNEGGQA